MSLFDERALREIVADEVRPVLREELSERGRPAGDVEFLPVAEAAARVAVAPATIRVWMAQGRLRRYHAGRELRVRTTELAELMGTPANSNGGNPSGATPEKEAELYLDRRWHPGRKTRLTEYQQKA
jgi:excisionase family DNA binding protein